MVFAYQVLSMTNYCNLRCKYCDWNKEYGFVLSEGQKEAARNHIKWTREFADREFGDFLMGVYSGGEPFVFPELIEMFLETYQDKWIRLSTNGLFDPKRCIPILRRHGKLILTASLDGMDMEGNRARFSSQGQLQRVLKNIYEALNQGFFVMVLCTINTFNIDTFFDFTKELYRLYRPYMDYGQLVMPAHYITAYTTPVGLPSPEQEQRFIGRLEREIDTDPVISSVDWHYRRLLDYVKTKQHNDCTVDRWSRCAHFLDDQMVGAGIMNSYLCPMRGYGDLGEFDTKEPINGFGELYERKYQEVYGDGQRCRCFVDWTAFDAVLKGEVSLERAEKWFGFFKDDTVKQWILKYQKEEL